MGFQLSMFRSYSPSLEAIKESAADCKRSTNEETCPYTSMNMTRVHGRGPATADLAIVGQCPGTVENTTGIPFSGTSGKLLKKIMKEVDIDHREVFMTNLVRCMPPKGKRIISRAITPKKIAISLSTAPRSLVTFNPVDSATVLTSSLINDIFSLYSLI